MFRLGGALLAASCLTACFNRPAPTYTSGGNVSTVIVRQPINELEREPVPGTVNDVWAETMIDTVRVPGQLDPTGTYYRPSHNTLVEIRPGRYQKVQYPDEYGANGAVSVPGPARVITPQGIENTQ